MSDPRSLDCRSSETAGRSEGATGLSRGPRRPLRYDPNLMLDLASLLRPLLAINVSLSIPPPGSLMSPQPVPR
jgi:hypothetical protein